MKTIGVIVARMQCAELTAGHRELIDYIIVNHDVAIIVLGVPRTPENATNPLTYQIREEMVSEYVMPYSENYVYIRPLSNHRNNIDWSTALDELIETTVGKDCLVTLYSGRDGFIPFYSGKFETKELNFGIECSATEERSTIANQRTGFTKEMRRGIIYAHQTRIHQTYETVDIALLKKIESGDVQILLGQKENEALWRFPGGFINPGETINQAAKRELKEETYLDTEDNFKIISDYMLDEWRIRKMKGVSHRTFLCVANHTWGKAEAGDDLAIVSWYPLRYIMENVDTMVIEEHRIMMKDLARYVEKQSATSNPNRI